MDLKRQGTDGFPYVFDETRAERIFRWFGMCRHVRGPFQGQPIELLDWQIFDLGCSFGWVHMDSGARRFRVSFEERARGNVKTTEKSGECLYFMCADAIYPPGQPNLAVYEHMPEIECAAVDREQAKRVWGDARAMALFSPDIEKRMENDWKMREFCYDSYNATHLSQEMIDEYGEYAVIEIRQGMQTLSLPTKRFRELVMQGLIVHDGNPLLTWCVSNAVEIQDNNENIKLSKKHKDDSQRIDLLAAVINAMVRAILFPAVDEVEAEIWTF
jgi:phage terminase large subunit-like protein